MMRDGQGTLMYANGARYIGTYKEDFRDGDGQFFWANGNYYSGEWKESVMCGEGRKVNVDGTV